MLPFIAPPLTSTRLRLLAPMRNKGSRRQFVNGYADVTGPRTSHETIALPAEFEAFRFIYSTDAASPINLNKATYSVSAIAGSIPKDAAGSSLTPQPVTFNAGGADSLPGAATGSRSLRSIEWPPAHRLTRSLPCPSASGPTAAPCSASPSVPPWAKPALGAARGSRSPATSRRAAERTHSPLGRRARKTGSNPRSRRKRLPPS